jgi:hypothetical protein
LGPINGCPASEQSLRSAPLSSFLIFHVLLLCRTKKNNNQKIKSSGKSPQADSSYKKAFFEQTLPLPRPHSIERIFVTKVKGELVSSSSSFPIYIQVSSLSTWSLDAPSYTAALGKVSHPNLYYSLDRSLAGPGSWVLALHPHPHQREHTTGYLEIQKASPHSVFFSS